MKTQERSGLIADDEISVNIKQVALRKNYSPEKNIIQGIDIAIWLLVGLGEDESEQDHQSSYGYKTASMAVMSSITLTTRV